MSYFIFFHKSVINMSYMFIQNVRTGKNVNNNMLIMMIVIKIIVEFLKKCQTKQVNLFRVEIILLIHFSHINTGVCIFRVSRERFGVSREPCGLFRVSREPSRVTRDWEPFRVSRKPFHLVSPGKLVVFLGLFRVSREPFGVSREPCGLFSSFSRLQGNFSRLLYPHG